MSNGRTLRRSTDAQAVTIDPNERPHIIIARDSAFPQATAYPSS